LASGGSSPAIFGRSKRKFKSEPRQRAHVGGTIADFPPLTAQSVKHYHRVLSQALKAARQERVIDRNPADDAKAPAVEPSRYENIRPGALLGAAAGTQIYIPVLLAARPACGAVR
jgi:hypothetical protein